MSALIALWLQTSKLQKNAPVLTPGSEGPFSKTIILVFIAFFVLAAILACRLVVRGAVGAAKPKSEASAPSPSRLP